MQHDGYDLSSWWRNRTNPLFQGAFLKSSHNSHYTDFIMGAIMYQITSLTIVYSTVYSTQIKENIKAPPRWPLSGEFTGDRWIPRTKG